jgi:leucyl aminopeptidase
MTIQLSYGARADEQAAADAIVRFISNEELEAAQGEAAPIIQPQIDEAIKSAYAGGQFKAQTGQTYVISTLGLYPVATIIFAGYSSEVDTDNLRLAAAAAAKALKQARAEKAQLLLSEPLRAGIAAGPGEAQAAQALTEGLLLALHTRQPLVREPQARFELKEAAFVAQGTSQADEAAWQAGMARGRLFVEGVSLARDLTNLPGNDLTPERLAFHAEELAHEHDLEIEVIDEWSAAEQQMGGLLGVGQGSINPPRMIVIHYKGNAESEETWGLIGKGITFDTGGISLKRAEGMQEMISDMGGAAAVMGAMRIIAEAKPAVNVIAVIQTGRSSRAMCCG